MLTALFIFMLVLFVTGHWFWGCVVLVIWLYVFGYMAYWEERDPLGVERAAREIRRMNKRNRR